MSDDPEKVGEEIASEISEAIEAANEQTEKAEALAEHIAEAALEAERGRRVETIERDLTECLENQANLSQAMTQLVMQVEQMSGQLSTLQTLLPAMMSPQEKVDGLRESQEPNLEVVIQPEAPEPEMPQVVEKLRPRKRFL
jgi:chromosome segregation ATPase